MCLEASWNHRLPSSKSSQSLFSSAVLWEANTWPWIYAGHIKEKRNILQSARHEKGQKFEASSLSPVGPQIPYAE